MKRVASRNQRYMVVNSRVGQCVNPRGRVEQGTSLIMNSVPLRPTVGLCLRPYRGPEGGGLFLMSEVLLQGRVY